MLLKAGLRPNAVSLIGIGFAAMAGAAMIHSGDIHPTWVMWFAAAACVQLRLLCNLMDGLLAVEGGLKSPTGELFNELPDRIEDALVLVPLGYAGGTDWSVALGWSAACGAVATAYVRAVGAGLTGRHDFRGPMAKPHRMAAVTAICLIMAACSAFGTPCPGIPWGLALINLGIAVTCVRRIHRLATSLRKETRP